MLHKILVEPLGDGWSVCVECLDNRMVFRRGGTAETAGRHLAERLRGEGHTVEIEVRRRDGACAGRVRFEQGGAESQRRD
jgi:hypothetical protein